MPLCDGDGFWWGALDIRSIKSYENTLVQFGQRHEQHLSPTMLYIIGLGLADEKDISVKGLEIVKQAARVYLEAYTAVLLVDKNALVR